MKDKSFYNRIQKGYTLLFSIIVASIVLSIAAFILSVSRKQFILSSVSRDSTMAIYAADSAIQCAIGAYYNGYLDVKPDANGNPTSPISIPCMGGQHPGVYEIFNDNSYNLKNDANAHIYSYRNQSPLLFGFGNDSCALVTITNGLDVTTSKHRIFIESRGYNNQFSAPCDPSAAYNPRTVERAIRLIYEDGNVIN